MHQVTQGSGKKLLFVHGIGSSCHIWRDQMEALAPSRKVIAIDLPGHGRTPATARSTTYAGLAQDLEDYLVAEDLVGVDLVGHSLGGRLVLDMAKRGRAGSVVALAPGGFWMGWERAYLQGNLLSSIVMLRSLGSLRASLAHNPISRSIVLAALSARPWHLDGTQVQAELDSYAGTKTFVELVNDLATAPMQTGPAHVNTGLIRIGWGRNDRLCWPVQAKRALAAFPSAQVQWFADCGHQVMWDQPAKSLELIRQTMLADQAQETCR